MFLDENAFTLTLLSPDALIIFIGSNNSPRHSHHFSSHSNVLHLPVSRNTSSGWPTHKHTAHNSYDNRRGRKEEQQHLTINSKDSSFVGEFLFYDHCSFFFFGDAAFSRYYEFCRCFLCTSKVSPHPIYKTHFLTYPLWERE